MTTSFANVGFRGAKGDNRFPVQGLLTNMSEGARPA
jgi:hypothetical protein